MRRVILLTLAVLLCFSLLGHAKQFDLQHGTVKLKYSQSFPIRILFDNVIDASIFTDIDTNSYSNRTEVESQELDLSILAKRNELTVTGEISRGIIVSHTNTDRTSVFLKAGGKEFALIKNIFISDGKDGNPVVTIIAKGESGIVRINKTWNRLKRVPYYVIISRRLGIKHRDARDMIDEFGKLRIKNAFREAEGQKGDDVCSGDTVNLDNMSYQETFKLFLNGPKAQLSIIDSVLRLNLLCGNEGTKVDGIGTNITVSNNNENIILLDPIVSKNGEYIYDFNRANWLSSEPDAGDYSLFIDLGPTLSRTIPIRISQDGEVSLK